MIVAGRSVNVALEEVSAEELEPDPEQPRRYELSIDLQAKGLDPQTAKQPDAIELVRGFDDLVKSVIENQGISTPILVENVKGRRRVIDGDRRLGALRHILQNEKLLSENPGLKETLARIPCLSVEGPLSEMERLQLLSHIHLHLKPWGPYAKHQVESQLLQAKTSEEKTAAVMCIPRASMRKLREAEELAGKVADKKGSRALSYAREFVNINSKLRSPEVEAVVVKKIRNGLINDSVDIRNLRKILPDPDAKAIFLEEKTTIHDALNVVKAKEFQQSLNSPSVGLKDTIDRLVATLRTVKFEELIKYKGNRDLRKLLDEALSTLNSFKSYV
jgi:ParB family chromosome partitioning protein